VHPILQAIVPNKGLDMLQNHVLVSVGIIS